MPVVIALPDEIASLVASEGGDMDHVVVEAVIWQQYQRGRISAGKAAGLLGMRRGEFEVLRVERGVSLPFTLEELHHDLDWAAGRAEA